ncbi:putative chitinase [Salinibacter ruber]|nr:putative chitinase [Salinibacter ruber]
MKKVTEKINGGYNGLPTRKTEYNAIKENVDCSK